MKAMKIMGIIALSCLCLMGCTSKPKAVADNQEPDAPRIINIINFIRQTDFRTEDADRLLYEAVCEQLKLLNKHDLPATFLLQYDALINPKYQELLKSQLNGQSEIGGWWELTQPHVEAAGLKWRGDYSWDPHGNVGFSTGYTNEEREKLVDVYMAKFKEIFGTYPKSVGSWYIDAHTLGYMSDKYHIVASCNCKDQIGTDGYTLWGGYWNQAYYPSRKNGYMPAQTEQGQIPVPVFRMLGSDPIYQYDDGVGTNRQGVISLEASYKYGGADRRWVEYFLESMMEQPCLAFSYAQAGQENSFTWKDMRIGYELQVPMLDSLRQENKIKIETLAESGTWFKEQFKVTPATAVTAMKDVRNEGNKTVWFNSRYYRANLLWEKENFRFRDIHLFDENHQSAYLDKPGVGSQFLFYTLPLVDGFVWSSVEERAGMRIVQLGSNGEKKELGFVHPTVTEVGKEVLSVSLSDTQGHPFQILFNEAGFEVSSASGDADFSWALELTVAAGKQLPFTSIEDKMIKATFDGFDYVIACKEGNVTKAEPNAGYVLRIHPANGKIVVDCTNGR